MVAVILQIYEYLKGHKIIGVLSFTLITFILSVFLLHQKYKEDISDFLPLNNKYNKALQVYQNISGANKLFVIFQYSDSTKAEPDSVIMAIDAFVNLLASKDQEKMTRNVISQIDIDKAKEVVDFTYSNIPYFISDEDYLRMDSLLASDDYVSSQLAKDKNLLIFPVSSLLSENLQYDPLNLFTPIVSKLNQNQANLPYENYDGYIFSPDMKRAIVMLESPFGASETENNARLIELLEKCAKQIVENHPNISIHFTGGPAIAVGNAQQIKTDSLLAISLAIVLIVILLFCAFRNIWNLLLMVVSIAWGWLFAMGILSTIHNDVSVIVIGISSVVLGIAVNYPLHLIAHLQHTSNKKTALKEIVMPLVVGNITTVGAFLALVPLKSTALRDLGLFCSLLLIGTILFVLLYLPHLTIQKEHKQKNRILNYISSVALEDKKWIVGGVLLITLFLGYYSTDTTFDTNISHINYMTEAQKQDMSLYQKMFKENSINQKIYVVSEDSCLERALDKNKRIHPFLMQLQKKGLISDIQSCSPFVISKAEQKKRLEKWDAFKKKQGKKIEERLRSNARIEGFSEDAFDGFLNLLHTDFEPRDISFFEPLTTTFFSTNLSIDSLRKCFNVIDVVQIASDKIEQVTQTIEEKDAELYVFDVESMNSSIATRLSDDFNYIGWACGIIVFAFLWFSMGSLELAILSFLPMAISWIWILGIMSLVGIEFNVVNVILATFIFGQGDDYTIFMTEGCQYEYAYRRKMLSSYKNSIIISALIMFIGIGALIFAKHPALHSLAEVTIVGMLSVVLMAWLIPPLIFKWLVMKNGHFRKRPLSFSMLFSHKDKSSPIVLVIDSYRYKGIEITKAVKKGMKRYIGYFGKLNCSSWQEGTKVFIVNSGWGEFSLLVALEHPQWKIVAVEENADKRRVAAISAEGVVNNLSYTDKNKTQVRPMLENGDNMHVIILQASKEDYETFNIYNPIIIS